MNAYAVFSLPFYSISLSYDEVLQVINKFKEECHSAGAMLFDANTSGDKVFVIEKGKFGSPA